MASLTQPANAGRSGGGIPAGQAAGGQLQRAGQHPKKNNGPTARERGIRPKWRLQMASQVPILGFFGEYRAELHLLDR
jgi:hypothetical protein